MECTAQITQISGSWRGHLLCHWRRWTSAPEIQEYMPWTHEEHGHIKHATDDSIRPEHAKQATRVTTSLARRRSRGSFGEGTTTSLLAMSQGTPMRDLELQHPLPHVKSGEIIFHHLTIRKMTNGVCDSMSSKEKDDILAQPYVVSFRILSPRCVTCTGFIKSIVKFLQLHT
jgi:hypothetical protein